MSQIFELIIIIWKRRTTQKNLREIEDCTLSLTTADQNSVHSFHQFDMWKKKVISAFFAFKPYRKLECVFSLLFCIFFLTYCHQRFHLSNTTSYVTSSIDKNVSGMYPEIYKKSECFYCYIYLVPWTNLSWKHIFSLYLIRQSKLILKYFWICIFIYLYLEYCLICFCSAVNAR